MTLHSCLVYVQSAFFSEVTPGWDKSQKMEPFADFFIHIRLIKMLAKRNIVQ